MYHLDDCVTAISAENEDILGTLNGKIVLGESGTKVHGGRVSFVESTHHGEVSGAWSGSLALSQGSRVLSRTHPSVQQGPRRRITCGRAIPRHISLNCFATGHSMGGSGGLMLWDLRSRMESSDAVHKQIFDSDVYKIEWLDQGNLVLGLRDGTVLMKDLRKSNTEVWSVKVHGEEQLYDSSISCMTTTGDIIWTAGVDRILSGVDSAGKSVFKEIYKEYLTDVWPYQNGLVCCSFDGDVRCVSPNLIQKNG